MEVDEEMADRIGQISEDFLVDIREVDRSNNNYSYTHVHFDLIQAERLERNRSISSLHVCMSRR